MSRRPIQLRDRILYTQVLTQAGYIVHSLVGLDLMRGGGMMARGYFERCKETVDSILVSTHGERFVVGEIRYDVTMLDGGLFALTEVASETGGAR